MLHHLASHLSTLGERESEESEFEESENEERESEEGDVSLSHSQRDLVAQEVSVMHQVSYSSSVSTSCRNEIKDRNYKSVQQHIFISFSFSGKKNGCPHYGTYARCHFPWKFWTTFPAQAETRRQ